MKKLWIVLLSLALVAAFCMPAAAVDVKFSGSYYVAGDYYSDLDMADSGAYLGSTTVPAHFVLNPETGVIEEVEAVTTERRGRDRSTAFFRQRLRIQTEFVVSPGLSLITRFDALEKIWGDNNWSGGRGNTLSRPHNITNNTTKEQENIEFEQAYIQYMSKVGLWWVGYAPHDFWGTTFGDSTQTQALVQWILPLNQNWTIGAKYFKTYEGSSSLFNGARGNDSDDNAYVGIASYKNENLEGGLKVAYRRLANNKDGLQSQTTQVGVPFATVDGWLLTPYFKGQFGPVTVQSELEYWNGDIEFDSDDPDGNRDADMEMWAFYADAKVDLGPAYVGGRFVYASGQDYDRNKITGSNFNPAFEACWGGVDLRQTLILWNDDVTNWAGNVWGLGPGVKNAFFYQVYGGYKWDKFNFFASLAYAKADEAWAFDAGNPYEVDDDDYGYELDVTATYSITNNLKYMVGAGYLWTGDYFKGKAKHGSPAGHDVDDIYLITNKLTLTF